MAIYNGDLVAGSLLIPESRKIASLMLNGVNENEWRKAIESENVLQKRNPLSSIRQSRLIKKRLSTMDSELWRIIAESPLDVTTQALLAASIKHSRILGDFMLNVIKENWRIYRKNITLSDWNNFIDHCAQIDPGITSWTESTQKKLRQVVLRILAEAKYVDNTRKLNLLPVIIHPEIEKYLTAHKETYVLNCMHTTQ
jgi:hypothetical protein